MEVRIEDQTRVFDVQLEFSELGEISLHSEAGVNVWPKGKVKDAPLMPRKMGLRMGPFLCLLAIQKRYGIQAKPIEELYLLATRVT